MELAHGGTLLLDEIGDLPMTAQSKLLRFLQDRTFERVGGRETLVSDARILAATHRDVDALAARGEFREDLYYRVRVVEIVLPPLRDRGRDEVLALARHFAQVYAKRHGRGPVRLSKEGVELLATYRWPGNVRELEHAIERAVVMAPTDVLGPELLGIAPAGRALAREAPRRAPGAAE